MELGADMAADAWEMAQVRMVHGRVRDFTGDPMQSMWEPEDVRFMAENGLTAEEMAALVAPAQ